MVHDLVTRAAHHQDQLYVYSFAWGESNVLPEPLEFIYGAAHALEIPFFHGNVNAEGLTDWLLYSSFTEANRPGRRALSDAMVTYLAQFARTGNPNGPGIDLPEWAVWSADSSETRLMRLDADLSNARIEMDTEELSVASIKRALDAEAPQIRQHVRAVLAAMQPYAIAESGNDPFGSCNR